MKSLGLMLLGLGICIYAEPRVWEYPWVPGDAPRWNPFAIKESGIGRSLSRVLSEEANTAFHHGLFEHGPRRAANPLSSWLDAGIASLGFPGRLKYRPVAQFPLKPFEVKQALEQVEKNIRFAFELDPGNYAAYDVYQFFLTTDVVQTEFGTSTGEPLAKTQLDDDDEEDDRASEKQHADSNHDGRKPQIGETVNLPGGSQGKELERRNRRAIEITDTSIRKFRPSQDPERYVTGAVIWYNRFMLMAPDVAARQASVDARNRFALLGFPTLQKMQFYLEAAKRCEAELVAKGLWDIRPEPRRKDYAKVFQFVDALSRTLDRALENNRFHMPASYLGILGELGSRSRLNTDNPDGGIR
ncbi:MAG TPA: hypothetical protein VK673_21205 [Chthoniobacterales bacterium]|nr:hypothetical protein [Chthoniobacterales bacterium]